ncbi:hypothetical protein OS493_033655 [Desmophyllum pertusum]|uniref:Uncharacterized protein n=1 Tax=Desmophyllum pertusum TaxID=174260 RepID=A0A9W9Y817_9CNID|nr:hypothetical protein OS493_033655 [Desmophyllum pertusum]
MKSLNSLPENGIPSDLLTVETDDQIVSDENVQPDPGPATYNPADDTVYNESTEMSSFLPVGEHQQQEIEAVRNQLLSAQELMEWPSVGDEPLNEYQTPFLATMAFLHYSLMKYKDENECLHINTTELDQDIEAGKKAADTACQYVDWLLSTDNPMPPDHGMWIKLQFTHARNGVKTFLIMS